MDFDIEKCGMPKNGKIETKIRKLLGRSERMKIISTW